MDYPFPVVHWTSQSLVQDCVAPLTGSTSAISAPTDIGGCVLWLTSQSGVLEATGPDDPCEAGDAVAAWRDQSGNGNDPVAINNGTFQTSPSRVVLTEAVDQIRFSGCPASSFGSLFIRLKTSDAQWVLLNEDGVASEYAGVVEDGSGSSTVANFVPTYYTNGTLIPEVPTRTRDLLHSAWSIGDWVNVGLTGDFSNIANLVLLGFTTSAYGINGEVKEIVMYDSVLSMEDIMALSSWMDSR